MALINIDSVILNTLRELKKIQSPGGIELLSYKRNRTIAMLKRQDGDFLIREEGYETEEINASDTDLAKKLKALIKKEFPRSRKVRMFKFSHPDELTRIHQKI